MIRRSFKALTGVAAAVALATGVSTASAAPSTHVLFDPTGGGSGAEISGLNLNVGNSLAQGANTSAIGETFTVHYQSNVGTINYTGAPGVGTLGTDYFITVVATLKEAKTFENGSPLILAFGNGVGVESVEMYINTVNTANASTGAGYKTGTLILSANQLDIISGGFSAGAISGWGAFDGTNGNGQPDQYSISGSGSTTLEATPDYVNTAYFQGLTAGDVLTLLNVNTLNKLPFEGVEPSSLFADGSVNPNLSTINGLSEDNWNLLSAGQKAAVLAQLGLADDSSLVWGDDVQFQTNGDITFNVVHSPVVPEPATAAMGLLGLVGLAAAARRRRNA